MNQLVILTATQHAPALVAAAGERAAYRFLEFFTAQIRNPHTRRAYARAVGEFCAWLEAACGVTSITEVNSVHVAMYLEELGRERVAADGKASRLTQPSIKQRFSAVR